MDSDEKFWLGIWAMVLAFLMGGISCATVLAWHKIDKWDKAVSNGADPMVVACALDGHAASTAICTILAQNRK
jgi:hypothetical protein